MLALLAVASAQDPVPPPCVSVQNTLGAQPDALRPRLPAELRDDAPEDPRLTAAVVTPPRLAEFPVFEVALAGAAERWPAAEVVPPTLVGQLAMVPGLRTTRTAVGRMDRPARIWVDGALLQSNLE